MSNDTSSAATLDLSSGSLPPTASGRVAGNNSSRGTASRVAGQDANFPRAVPAGSLWAADAPLPREHLLAQLRREIRRADRSEAPLSLAVYRTAEGGGPREDAALCALLCENKRETDIVGVLEPGVVSVICADTGADGIRAFIKKIDAAAAGLVYSVESSTHPNHILDLIGDTHEATLPRANSLLLQPEISSSRGGYPLKRTIDIISTLFALILLLPIMLAAALAVRLSSPGPIIFRQNRIGRDGRPFSFYKFRSMVANGDDRIHREYVANLIKGDHDKLENSDDASLRFKMKADPRVTRVGRFIRKTSIDELPQLFNVLKGDMSLVGPRPPLPYEAENYRSWHLRRVLNARPGITGLWQVEGRSRVTFDEMVRMDLRYIGNCSLSLDLLILVKTVRVVLKGIGGG